MVCVCGGMGWVQLLQWYAGMGLGRAEQWGVSLSLSVSIQLSNYLSPQGGNIMGGGRLVVGTARTQQYSRARGEQEQ